KKPLPDWMPICANKGRACVALRAKFPRCSAHFFSHRFPVFMTEINSALVLIGAPGSGKTTLARGLAGSNRMLVIETGNLLGAEAKRGTPLGREIMPYQAAGNLVPSDLVKRVISAELARSDGETVLFDGFPRNMP